MQSIYFLILFFIIGITSKQIFEEFDTNGKQTKDQAEAALEEALGCYWILFCLSLNSF